jgi:undecaprenyl-diphosphatase
MLENINDALFALINATPASPSWVIALATFIAKQVILIVPLLAAALWLWGQTSGSWCLKCSWRWRLA